MVNSNLILPECYVDTLFTNMVLTNMHEDGTSNHQANINDVAKSMKIQFQNRKVIGIVDDDSRIPQYFESFLIQDRAGGLLLKKHPEKDHYLIVISPVFEHWAFKTSKDLNIKGNPFKSIKALKQATKSLNVDKNPKVKNLLNSIIQKKDSPVKKMQTWIREIFA